MKVVQRIPKSQVSIIIDALTEYKDILDRMIALNDKYDIPCCEIRSKSFDINSLKGLLDGNVKVTLSQKQYETFHLVTGVDFPEYNNIK
jgi:hypothetical protein